MMEHQLAAASANISPHSPSPPPPGLILYTERVRGLEGDSSSQREGERDNVQEYSCTGSYISLIIAGEGVKSEELEWKRGGGKDK